MNIEYCIWRWHAYTSIFVQSTQPNVWILNNLRKTHFTCFNHTVSLISFLNTEIWQNPNKGSEILYNNPKGIYTTVPLLQGHSGENCQLEVLGSQPSSAHLGNSETSDWSGPLQRKEEAY